MLTRVDISNYRGFKSYRMEGLARVNLLLGKNNSGKTALLESVHLLASGGDPTVLANTASGRGEVALGVPKVSRLVDVSHFFHGHDIDLGTQFSLRSDNDASEVVVEVVPLQEVDRDERLPGGIPMRYFPTFGMKITARRGKESTAFRTLYLSENGTLVSDPRLRPLLQSSSDAGERPPVVLIAPDSLAPLSLGRMWNNILASKQEVDVRKAMQILEPRLEDIVFQATEDILRHTSARAGILVSFTGDARRFPLGSMGDGMRRLLALSISLIHARHGLLLVDEIDTGLHYSVLAEMWKLVVGTAAGNDIQVFATTHSWDCVDGLHLLCKREPHLMEQVAVHKIDRALDHSVPFVGASFVRAVDGGIELR